MLHLTPYAVSGILLFLTYFPLFLFVHWKGRTKVSRVFAYHLLSVSGWGPAAMCIGFSKHWPYLSVVGWTWGYVSVLYIPVILTHCILLLTQNRYIRYILPVIYGQAVIFTVLTLMGRLYEPEFVYKFDSMWFPAGNHLFLVSFLIWELIIAAAHSYLIYYWWRSHPEKKKQLIMLILAIPVGFGGGTMNYLPSLFGGLDIYPWGNFLVPFYSLMLAYAILHYQFLDISFVLRKGLIYAVTIVLISVMYYSTILVLEPVLNRFLGSHTAVSGLLAALILGVFFAPLRLKVEALVDATVFRGYTQEMARQNTLMQDELVRSEKFKMVSEITRRIVYEIRNPLTAIKTHNLLGLKRMDDKAFVEKKTQAIDRQVDRINDLLQQLLTFSNPSALNLQKHSIHAVIEDVLNIFRREFAEFKVEVVKNFEAKDVLLRLDPVQMRQALFHLIENAVEAMDKRGGGTLIVATQVRSSDEVRQINLQAEAQKYFEIALTDTGVGIPAENLRSIFDPFFSPQSTEETVQKVGLGLSITHRIIKEHNGFISVESAPGKTTFTIELPIS